MIFFISCTRLSFNVCSSNLFRSGTLCCPAKNHNNKNTLYDLILAGLPRARSARWTEPHTHGKWSTSFRLVVTWLTEHTYVRVYRLYGWGRGDYQKEGRGVSGVISASPHLLYRTLCRTLSIWSIDSCQNRIATDQYPMTIWRAHVSTHRSDVICLETVRWPVNCFTRSRTMFNFILFS